MDISEIVDEIIGLLPFFVIVGSFILSRLRKAKKQTREEPSQPHLPRTLQPFGEPVSATSKPSVHQFTAESEGIPTIPFHQEDIVSEKPRIRNTRRFSRSELRRALILGEILRPKYTSN